MADYCVPDMRPVVSKSCTSRVRSAAGPWLTCLGQHSGRATLGRQFIGLFLGCCLPDVAVFREQRGRGGPTGTTAPSVFAPRETRTALCSRPSFHPFTAGVRWEPTGGLPQQALGSRGACG